MRFAVLLGLAALAPALAAWTFSPIASEAVVSVNFTDNTSGLYLAALPEPSSAALLVVLSAGFLARRRRR